jgi:AmiR/NasT family two-component response regulator
MVRAAMDPESPASARPTGRLETNPMVEQAKGIIMAQQRCGPEEAFDVLRQASQQANVKVTMIAARLIEQVSGRPGSGLAGSEPCPDG